jgi:O-antigen/teichoic acid export membrane protein
VSASAASAQSRASGERALLNTFYRTAGEGLGRLASLALFAVAGHKLGASGLGDFVFAVAFIGFVMLPMELGLDRYLLRVVAQERQSAAHLFWNTLGFKLAMTVPLFALSAWGLRAFGYSHLAQATVWTLAPGMFSDSVARTQLAVFQAHERAGPPALADSLQRILSAALGIAGLFMGLGVVSVSTTYSIGSMVGVVIGFVVMARTIGVPAFELNPRRWSILGRSSLPFATQEVFVTILWRVDAVILSLVATQAAVGLYGAAYRLFESSMLITYALIGAFSAMYTYLGPHSDPPLRAVFERSVKLSLVLLVPLSVAFVTLSAPICGLIYGQAFVSAGVPLSILGPGVVMISVVALATSLMLSRESPMRIVRLTASMAGANVVLNLILIPPFGAAGAAAAMLVTEIIYATLIMRMASREVGGIRWTLAAGALAGGAGMLLVTLLLHTNLWVALGVGLTIYVPLTVIVERLVSPVDVSVVMAIVRRRLPPWLAGGTAS